MGFDIIGMDPVNEPGEYFRSNVWFWRPLVEYLNDNVECIDQKDVNGMSHNNGYHVSSVKAHQIAEQIQDDNAMGNLDEWIKQKKIEILLLDKETCSICEGTGVRTDTPLLGDLDPYEKDGVVGLKCNGCEGQGLKVPFKSNYPYDKETILEFGTFAAASGGFTIH